MSLTHFTLRIGESSIPKAPFDLWIAKDASRLSDRLCAYLSLRATLTTGQDPSGKICKDTLRGWARNVFFIAVYNVLGAGSEGHQRNKTALYGVLPDRSDSLASHLKRFVNSYTTANGLPRHRKPVEFYGRLEAALLLDGIDRRLLEKANGGARDVQLKFVIQMTSRLCIRPVSVTTTAVGQALLQHDATIQQTEIGFYDITLLILTDKGFSQATNKSPARYQTLEAVQRLEDLRFDTATTLIPLLIIRLDLYELDPYTRQSRYYDDIEQFISSRSSTFHVKESGLALLRQAATSAKMGKEALGDGSLTAASLYKMLMDLGQEVGLARCFVYCFRHGHGDRMRVAGGIEMAKDGLNHDLDDDVTRTSYSNASDDVRSSNLLLLDFADPNDPLKRRLEASRYFKREQMGRAVQAVVRSKLGASLMPTKQDPAVRAAYDEAIKDEKRMVERLAHLARLEARMNDGEELHAEHLKAKHDVQARRVQVRINCHGAALKQWKRDLPSRPICSTEQQDEAYSLLLDMMKAPPRLAEPNHKAYHAIAQSWKVAPADQSFNLDGMRLGTDEDACAEEDGSPTASN